MDIMNNLFLLGSNSNSDYLQRLSKPCMPTCFCEYFGKSVSRPFNLNIYLPESIKTQLLKAEKKILSFPHRYIPSIFEEEWVSLRDFIQSQLVIPSEVRLLPGMRFGPFRYLVKKSKLPHFIDWVGDLLISDHLYNLIKDSDLTGFESEIISLTWQRKKQHEQNPPLFHIIKPVIKLKYYTEIWKTCPRCGYAELEDIQDPVNENQIWDGSDFVTHNKRVYVSERVKEYFREWDIKNVSFMKLDPETGLIKTPQNIDFPSIKRGNVLISSIIPQLRYEAVKQQIIDHKNSPEINPLFLEPPVSLKNIIKPNVEFSGFILGNPNSEILHLISCYDIHIHLQNITSFMSVSEVRNLVEKVVGVEFEKNLPYARGEQIIIVEGLYLQLIEVYGHDGSLFQIVLWKQYNNPSSWDPIKTYQLCEKLSQAFLKAAPCEVRIEGRGVRLLSVESSKVVTEQVAGVEPDVATKILQNPIECFEMHIELEDNPPFPGVDDFLPIIQKVIGMDYREESYMLDSFKYIFEGSKLCCEFNEDYDRPGMTFHLELCKQGSKRKKWEPLKVYQLCEEMCKGFLDVCPCEVSIVGRGIGFLSMQSSISSDED